MTIVDTAPTLPKFGIGARINETFAIFGSRFVPFAAVGMVLSILSELPAFFLTGETASSSTFDASEDAAFEAVFGTHPVLAIVATVLVPVVLYMVMSGTLVLIAQDTRSGQPIRIGDNLGKALRRILPLVLVNTIAGMAIMLGLAALVIPGLWAIGVFAVVVPVIMIENGGFGSLGRSASLTKQYRWPIVGMVIVIYLLTMILYFAVGVATSVLPALVEIVLSGAVGGIGAALISIAMVVVYARLREIKEGAGVADLADVFA